MGAAGWGGSKLMVAVSADETLMLNLYFIFLICCHKTVFEICLHIISFITELRQALVREKKMVWLHQNCVWWVSWVLSHLPPCGEHLCIKNQRANTTPLKVQLPENQNPAPFRYKLCHSNQSLPCTKWQCLARTQQPHRSVLDVNFSGPAVLFSMTAREGWGSQRAKKCFWKIVPFTPFLSPPKRMIFVLSGVWVPMSTFAF